MARNERGEGGKSMLLLSAPTVVIELGVLVWKVRATKQQKQHQRTKHKHDGARVWNGVKAGNCCWSSSFCEETERGRKRVFRIRGQAFY